MYNLAIVITYFVEMLIGYIFFAQIGEKKYKPIICFLIGTCYFELGALCDIVFSNIIWLNATMFILINFLFAITCFSISIKKSLFFSVILDIFSTALEFSAIFIISNVTNTEVTAYVGDINFFILDVSVSKVLYFLTCIVLARFIKKDKSFVHFPIVLYFFPIAILGALIVFWDICANSSVNKQQQLLLSIVSAVLLMTTVILFINYQHNLEKEAKLIMLEKEFEKEETEKKYYEILERQNQELMIYAHDTKKHLAAIRELSENPQIDDYLSKMDYELKEHSKACHSGNHTLDVIINRYQTECNINKIAFYYDLKTTNLSVVEDYDLVTIIGNVLDNALDAAKESKQRKISLITNRRNDFDVIIITNSCDSAPEKDLSTTKKNKKLHGYGMKSVAKALKKYDGDYEWEFDTNKHEFITTIMVSSQ